MIYKKKWLFTRIGWAWPLQWWARGLGSISLSESSVTVNAFPFSTTVNYHDIDSLEVRGSTLILNHHGASVPTVVIRAFWRRDLGDIMNEFKKRRVKIMTSND